MRRAWVIAGAAWAASLLAAACQLVFPAELKTMGPGDASMPADALAPDAMSESGAYDGPTVYHDMTASPYWSTFDIATVDPAAVGFVGGAFDGQNVYFAPYANSALSPSGVVARYDTRGVFKVESSWSAFDTTSVNANARGFAGAAFDGRYIYFMPQTLGLSFFTLPSIVTRYDTLATFSEGPGWSIFDTATVDDAGASEYWGAAFDGRYLYCASSGGPFVRFDTKGTFETTASWSIFSPLGLNDAGNDAGEVREYFEGAVFDGRYVYFIPNSFQPQSSAPSFPSSVVWRYDTIIGDFSRGASWSSFDAKALGASGFSGGAFDGRYVYFVPGSYGSSILRLDTKGDFAAVAAWAGFDTSRVAAAAVGFGGGAFDGRYLYVVPTMTCGDGGCTSIILRCDTTRDCMAVSSWSSFETGALFGDAGPVGFDGAVFDGRYLYLVPNYDGSGQSGKVARFDAKEPPSMPKLPAFYGSFL
jgi:hypothetical protein